MKRALAAALLFLAPAPASGRELWSEGDASLEFQGSTRELLTVTWGTSLDAFDDAAAAGGAACVLAALFPDCPAFSIANEDDVVLSLTRLRMRFDLRLNEHVSAVATWDNELRAGHLDTFAGRIGEGFEGDSLFRAEGNLFDTDTARWTTLLYRGYLFLESEHVEATLGRQRVPWGVARLWNPIDRFNPIPPLALEADQNVGVDAIDAKWLFSGFTYLEAVFAPLRDLDDGSYALRFHGVLFDVDYSVMTGVFEEAWTIGFDLSGNIKDAAARVEVVYTDPARDVWPVGAPFPTELAPYWQVAGGVDYVFSIGSGLYLLVEHLYNGNALGFGEGEAGGLLAFFESTKTPPAAGLPVGPTYVRAASSNIFGGSRVVTFAENQTGFQLGYDLTPEVRGEVISIYDWNGQSAAFFPSVRWTGLDWFEITVGGQIFAGPRLSQYGDQANLFFVLAEVFF